MTSISFTVPGKPAPQGSKRHVGRGILIESCKDVGAWRERVAITAHNAMNSQPITSKPVAVSIEFVLPRPLSTPKRRSTPAATKKPDLDKLARAILDAITHTVIADDSQVVRLTARKRLAELDEAPHADITVAQVTP